MRQYNRKLVLENGMEIPGFAFGAKEDKILELVFNTSMVGYQEILSDPSYTDQAVVMTYPLIGNYGMSDEDYESKNPSVGAMIVREYNEEPSNWRSRETLASVMTKYGISGVSGVDTRRLTRIIREYGSAKVLITGMETSTEEAMSILNGTELAHDQVARVTAKEQYTVTPAKVGYHVVAVDCGMKLNIVRELMAHGCKVTVMPCSATARDINAVSPDGIFISNGPGDPTDAVSVIELVRELKGKYPIFGICLGHQIISLAYGAKTYKLKFGHRGGNHPVMDIETGKIEITSQNHSYAVDPKSIEGTGLKVTHINLLDDTVEGVSCEEDKVFSVQYHPESAPGPVDSTYLFDRFIKMMEKHL
ncbi:MAG: glutamine-hydrolyzing carbamoyl-phosphate synthase small subunit [Lachnospiraceae bacterium]|nr:glutamine-hydrolyzing carbamoyl-phosphate synthase small subunit [Lachnospiraceae bacterium]